MINEQQKKRILKMAINKWGPELQCLKSIEEMSELTKELIKHKFGKNNVNEIIDEIADVKIMIEQLELIFHCHHRVNEQIGFKISRLEKRLNYVDA